ncbi:MAG: hypothetical protein ACM3XP_04935 [Nitrososphaerales archaeon]
MKEIWFWFIENYEIIIALSIVYGFFKSLRRAISKDVAMLSDKIDKMEIRLDRMENRLIRVEDYLRSIDQRLYHLEGAFEERGRWESRRTGTERE